MASRNEFLTDMCYALVDTNIPFNKLQSTPFKNFLQKYVNQNIPDESSKFKELVSNIEDDAQYVQKVKSILSTTPIISDLTFIRSHLSELPNSITKLEKQNSTLNYQINVVETVRDGLKTIENEKGQILYEKFKSVFDRNPRYNILKLYNNLTNGKDIDLKEDPAIISCYKQCPITSVDVERVFSQLKHILSDRRHNFKEKKLECI
ncbi:hypothetical protein QTP88_004084 [Uroleucon formosanum]